MLRRLYAFWIGRRLISGAAVLLVTAVLGFFAARVRPDYSIEHFFPVWDEARHTYDRFKKDFPREDSQAVVVVRAPDLFTPKGLARLQALEEALEELPEVTDVEGPMSARDIVGDFGTIDLPQVFESPEVDAEAIEAGRKLLTEHVLFAWGVASPDGRAVSIRVSLTPDAASSAKGRQSFYDKARAILDEHDHLEQELILSGLPSTRVQLANMVGQDLALLVPLALAVILLLLLVTFRSVVGTLAAFVTIVVAVVWSHGVLGILGYPITMISSILPIAVMIISVSDSVHIVNDFFKYRSEGKDRREALIEAMEDSFVPCLATEVVIACGFLSLIAVNIVGIVQFGIVSACAMLLTWLANVTVLPLLLTWAGGKGVVSPDRGQIVRTTGGLANWIARQVVDRPRVVVATAVLILGTGGLLASRVEKRTHIFGDTRKDTSFYRDLKKTEETHGGIVPLAIYVESARGDAENAVLEPAVLRAMDRAAALMRSYPEIKYVHALPDYLRKAHAGFAGEEGEGAAGDLPGTRQLAAQEVLFIDGDGLLRDVLSHDRSAATVIGYVADIDTERIAEILGELETLIEREQATLDGDPQLAAVRMSLTSQVRLFHEVNLTLTMGLLASLGGAVLVTLLVFCIVLRSVKLGLIGLIPNVAPMVLVFASMAILDISLRPSTVVVFSIILVIADDDTVQYLARLRGHFRKLSSSGHTGDLHREAALDCLRSTGQAMFVTSAAVSLGFLLLTLSNSQAVVDIGKLVGITLFFAVFADLFLSPLLVMKLRPHLGPRRGSKGDQADK